MTVQREGSKTTLFAEDRIDTYNAPQFASEIEEALPGTTELILDFSGLRYISSTGLRALMLAAKAMARQGEVRIVGVNEGVYDILETTGFTGVMDVERAT